MFLNKIVFVLCLMSIIQVRGKVTDEEYALMPELFHLDNFDRCMFLGEKALYCSITVELAPIGLNHSKVWKIIQEVSNQKKNFRHDWLRHGICVPHSCPEIAHNVSELTNNKHLLNVEISKCYINKYQNLGLKGHVTKINCETDQPRYTKDAYDIIVALSLASLLGLIIFASFYEGTARYKTQEEYEKITNTTFGKLISCFSLPKNWKRLGSTSDNPDVSQLNFMNGMRFYNIILVVMAHTIMVAFAGPVINPQYTENVTEDPTNMIFINGNYVIQTFLLQSGWLLAYNFFLRMEGRKDGVKFYHIFLAFLNRYIRLTPCLLVMVAISGTWLYHFNRGPLWDKIVGDEYRNCRTNWWANLLYINNHYKIQHMCMLHSWYLAADTQLFLLSLLMLMLMCKYQRVIKYILGVCLTIGILVPGIINYIYSYDILIREYPEPLYRVLLDVPEWTVMTIAGYTNISGYVMGVTTGYIFYKYRNKKILTKKLYVMFWWIIIWTLPLFIIFMGIPLYQDDYEYTRFGSAVYVALAKPIFILGICLACFGIAQGTGWFLRDCIVWQPVQILGRLTYCVYLVHLAAIRVRAGQMRTPVYLSSYMFFIQILGDLVTSYIFALFLCLFVEMPTSALQKLIMPPINTNKKNEELLENPCDIIRVQLVNGIEISKV